MRDSLPFFFSSAFYFIYDSYWGKIDVSYVNIAEKEKGGTEKNGEKMFPNSKKKLFSSPLSSNLWQR